MRSLIRPMLFLIARLMLFLTVVAWIASQWWSVTVWIPDHGSPIRAAIGEGGYSLFVAQGIHRELAFDLRRQLDREELRRNTERMRGKDPEGLKRIEKLLADSIVQREKDKILNYAGVAIYGRNFPFIGIHHAWVVTLCVLAYAGLKYRYRPRAVPSNLPPPTTSPGA